MIDFLWTVFVVSDTGSLNFGSGPLWAPPALLVDQWKHGPDGNKVNLPKPVTNMFGSKNYLLANKKN